MERAKGMDVSRQNRSPSGRLIDWNLVDVDFAIIRCNDGWLDDPDFQHNLLGAKTAGIPFGIYQAFYPNVDPVKQARALANNLLASGALFAAGDFEKSQGLSPSDYWHFANPYIQTFEQMAGQLMWMYTGIWFGSTFIPGSVKDHPLWLAWPSTVPDPSLPTGWNDWKIWQYSWTTSFNGVYDTTVDADYFNGSLQDFKDFFNLTPQPPQPHTTEERLSWLEQFHPRIDDK